jgi:hypothetical protein
MPTIANQPAPATAERLETAASAPRDVVFELSRIYLEVGLKPADALRSALADFECYFEERQPCAI